MRRSSVALVVLAAGLTATAAVRRAVARRRAAGSRVPAPARPLAAPAAAPAAPPTVVVDRPAVADDAVVLPFARKAGSAPAQPAATVRCGDTGGRTKAGAPCGARATGEGRCHHHRIAA